MTTLKWTSTEIAHDQYVTYTIDMIPDRSGRSRILFVPNEKCGLHPVCKIVLTQDAKERMEALADSNAEHLSISGLLECSKGMTALSTAQCDYIHNFSESQVMNLLQTCYEEDKFDKTQGLILHLDYSQLPLPYLLTERSYLLSRLVPLFKSKILQNLNKLVSKIEGDTETVCYLVRLLAD